MKLETPLGAVIDVPDDIADGYLDAGYSKVGADKAPAKKAPAKKAPSGAKKG